MCIYLLSKTLIACLYRTIYEKLNILIAYSQNMIEFIILFASHFVDKNSN